MASEAVKEVIFVGLPGPSHHYGGLAPGNVASEINAGDVSRPREAVRQAFALADSLRALGLEVGILPPQLRPCLASLREAGFAGSTDEIIAQAARDEPELLGRVSSSACMWVANAATVTAAADSADGRLHLTPANLVTHLHRAIEAAPTQRVLSQIFAGHGFVCHAPLPPQREFSDEGAANHLRLAPAHGEAGLNIFVYGRGNGMPAPQKHPARQTLTACRALARRHGVTQALFVQQNPQAIDAGVFHNDVIAVANENLLLVHEQAFAQGKADIARITQAYEKLHPGQPFYLLEIAARDLTLEEAVATYFFNSQIVSLPQGGMAIIAPQEVREHARASELMQRLIADPANPLEKVIYLDLRQSMKNGGGPACLRLRVPMTSLSRQAVAANARVLADDALMHDLQAWATQHYRETLAVQELAEAKLYHECRAALRALEKILRLSLVGE